MSPSEKTLYFDKITDLSKFLGRENLQDEELSKYLALNTFSEWGIFGIYLSLLTSEGEVQMASSFGVKSEHLDNWRNIQLSWDLPPTEAIKENRIVWVSDPEELKQQYPDLQRFPAHPELQTSINAPINLSGAPIGVVGVFSAKHITHTPERLSFLEAIAGMIGLYKIRLNPYPNGIDPKSIFLTPRQRAILNHLALKQTNIEIGQSLSFSTSTIRHETMKIYQLFGVTSRKEAVEFAYQHRLL